MSKTKVMTLDKLKDQSKDVILTKEEYDAVVNSCFENGVSVAPGIDFGKDFGMFLRVCFTGESPDRLEKGAERLRKVLLNI